MPEGDRDSLLPCRERDREGGAAGNHFPMAPGVGARTPTAVSAGSSSVLNIKSKTAAFPAT